MTDLRTPAPGSVFGKMACYVGTGWTLGIQRRHKKKNDLAENENAVLPSAKGDADAVRILDLSASRCVARSPDIDTTKLELLEFTTGGNHVVDGGTIQGRSH